MIDKSIPEPRVPLARLVAVQCPTCGYDLRGLSECRCPECGLQFDRDDLAQPRFHRHAYLFEEQPDAVLKSFLLTYLRCHRPRSFWTVAAQPGVIHMGRVTAFAVGSLGLFLVCGWLLYTVRNTVIAYLAFKDLAAQGITPMPSWHELVTAPNLLQYLGLVLPTLALPVLSFLVLLPFRQTLGRCRVEAKHLARCVAYALPMFNTLRLGHLLLYAFAPVLAYNFTLMLLMVSGYCWPLTVGLGQHCTRSRALQLVVVSHFILLLSAFTGMIAYAVSKIP